MVLGLLVVIILLVLPFLICYSELKRSTTKESREALEGGSDNRNSGCG